MSFDWRDYLTLAQELIQQRPPQLSSTNSEARYRAAISRAYYAVHHQAAQYLRVHGPYYTLRGSGISRHGDVYNQFMSGPGEEHSLFGSKLYDLYESRKKSDYNSDGRWLTSNGVAFIVSSARQLLNDLDTIKKIDASANKNS